MTISIEMLLGISTMDQQLKESSFADRDRSSRLAIIFQIKCRTKAVFVQRDEDQTLTFAKRRCWRREVVGKRAGN